MEEEAVMYPGDVKEECVGLMVVYVVVDVGDHAKQFV